jgi:hypothetical protein
MKKHYIKFLITFIALVILLSGCGQLSSVIPTATAYPTYTPLPTFTPLPTPIPSRWDVKVLSVTTPKDFDGFVPKVDTSRFIVIAIEYTYQGLESTVFSPASLILLNMTTSAPSQYEGMNGPPIRYQPEGITSTISLSDESPIISMSQGKTRIDKFGWVFPKALTNFRLYFPEMEAIDITVD